MLSMIAIDMRPQFESTVNTDYSSYLADITTYTETQESFNQGDGADITEAEISVVDRIALLSLVEDLKKQLREEKEKNIELERYLKEYGSSTLKNENATETHLSEYEWTVGDHSTIIKGFGDNAENVETENTIKGEKTTKQDCVILDSNFKLKVGSGNFRRVINHTKQKEENTKIINETAIENMNVDDILIKDLGSQLKESLILLNTEINHQLEEKHAKIVEQEKAFEGNNETYIGDNSPEKDDQIFLKDILIDKLESQLQESLLIFQAHLSNQLNEKEVKIEELERAIMDMNEQISQDDIHVERLNIHSKKGCKEEAEISKVIEEDDDLECQIQESHALFQEVNYQLGEKVDEMRELMKYTKLKDTQIEQLNSLVQELKQELQKQLISLQEKNNQIDEKEIVIRDMEEVIQNKNRQITQQGNLIQSLKSDLDRNHAGSQRPNNHQTEEILKKEELRKVIQEKDKQITLQISLVHNLESQLKKSQDSLQETKKTVNDLEYKIGLAMEVGLMDETLNNGEVGKLKKCLEDEKQKAIKAAKVHAEETKKNVKHLQELKMQNEMISSELLNEKIKVQKINEKLKDTKAQLQEAEENLANEAKKVTLTAKMTEVAITLGHEAKTIIASGKEKDIKMKSLLKNENTSKIDTDDMCFEGQEENCKILNKNKELSEKYNLVKENNLPGSKIFEGDTNWKELNGDKNKFSTNSEVNSIFKSRKIEGSKKFDCLENNSNTSCNKEETIKNGDIKFIPKIKSDKKKRKWNPYCKEEDQKILKYMKENKLSGPQRGTKMWKEMEMKNVCPGRTWQSMKERWIKSIEPKLQNATV